MGKGVSMRKARQGFTLVELSIVLVVFGLLVGGVLAGQSLIHAADLRRISKEYTNFKIATETFKDKYFFLPGDMPNATDYWGKLGSTYSACVASAGGTATCDGDGDGTFLNKSHSVTEEDLDVWFFWQQLALAELLGRGKRFNGFVNDDLVSRSQYAASLWVPTNLNPLSAVLSGPLGNGLYFGNGDFNGTPFILTEDAYNLDMKIDDGKPGSGAMRTFEYAGCVTVDKKDYDLSNQLPGCGEFVFSF